MKNEDHQLKQLLEKERQEIKEMLSLMSNEKMDDEEKVEEIAHRRGEKILTLANLTTFIPSVS